MVRNVIFAILILLVFIFVLQNTEVVEVKFWSWQINMSRALMMLCTFAVGLIAGWLLKIPKRKKGKSRLKD